MCQASPLYQTERGRVSRQKTLGAACVILIVGSAAWLFHFYGSRPSPGEPIAFRRPAACSACGKSYISAFGEVPAKCESCGARALWHAVKCGNGTCGAIVPVIRGSAAPGKGQACPKCGETRFKEVGPDDLE